MSYHKPNTNKKYLILVLLFIMIAVSLSAEAKASIKKNSDGTYSYYQDGKLLKKTWIKKGTKKLYYAGKNGKLYTNGVYKIGKEKYGFNAKGAVQYGKAKIGENWYYFGSTSGNMRTCIWKEIKGEYYYFKKNGKMARNQWIKRYYLDDKGHRIKNAWKDNRYLDKTGKAYIGLEKIDEYYYYFDAATYEKITDQTLTIDGWVYKFDHEGKGTLVGDLPYYTPEEQKLLSCIIYCEAGNQEYTGKLAVGMIIMNRVHSKLFPSTIEEVVYQKEQFTPASNGTLEAALKSYSKLDTESKKAALEVLKIYTDYKRGNPVYLKRNSKKIDFSSYLYFMTKSSFASFGLTTKYKAIGDHVFFKTWK